jgi:short-subunit dehydrogenase
VRLGADTRVLVTGATKGIGRALAQEFAARECRVGLVARNPRELSDLAAELRAGGAQADPLPADVGVREQVDEAVARFIEQAGGLEVLVANAGVSWYGPFRDMPVEEAERMTRINWLGTLYSVHAALPHMLDQGSGHIVIVSSAASYRAFPWAAVYGATKFAQRGFLEALRHELSGTGVEVTGVYPGEVRTHLHDDDTAARRMPDWYRSRMAIPPERVARATVKAVAERRPSVNVPPLTRMLGPVHGISPALADRMLRLVLGRTAAPWRRQR